MVSGRLIAVKNYIAGRAAAVVVQGRGGDRP